MREDELALGKGRAEGLREGGHPGLGSAVALVHGVEVLVVDVDAIQCVGNHELRERAGRGDGVRTLRGGLVRLAEGGHDDVDARLGVLGLLRGTDVRRERSEGTGLVEGTLEGEEGESDDVEALNYVHVRYVRNT